MSAPNAPIGKFEKLVKGEWVECRMQGLPSNWRDFPDEYRFRPNTYLPDISDAPEGWWYEGDEGWLGDQRFVVVYDDTHGRWIVNFDNGRQTELFTVSDRATHTPPKKKYKRWTGEYDSCYGHPTEKRYIEVENQRVGEAERRETVRLKMPAGFTVFEADAKVGRRQGPQDRRTGEGA